MVIFHSYVNVYQTVIYIYIYWLVVSTPLKNISQLGWLFPHQPVYIIGSQFWPIPIWTKVWLKNVGVSRPIPYTCRTIPWVRGRSVCAKQPRGSALEYHDISSKIMIYHLVGGIPTPLKNISQWEGLSHVLWKIKSVWNHQPVII